MLGMGADERCKEMNGRIFPLLASLFALLIMASAVSAQETSDGPVLQEADVRVTP